MGEYINRERLIESIKNDCLEQVFYTKEDAINCIEAAPAEDVEPVFHGKWESDGSSVHYCSECGVDINLVACERWKYERCPLCGTIMDLED